MKTKTAISKIISLVLSLVIVMGVLPITAFAAPAEGAPLGELGGVKYTYLGASSAKVSGYDKATLPADLTIPNTVEFSGETYNVTEIANNAFTGCEKLTSVVIPNSVEYIGNFAFSYCDNLTSLTIPASLQSISINALGNITGLTEFIVLPGSTTFSTENGVLYSHDKSELVLYPAGKTAAQFTIPSFVKTIRSVAFDRCPSLTSIIIPDSVKKIEVGAFQLLQLTSITIPASVTNISANMFSLCNSLANIYVATGNLNYSAVSGVLYNHDKTSLIYYPPAKPDTSFSIPNTVTSIGDSAFRGCASLTSIVIPDSVQNIASSGFALCTSLTSIVIPASVQNIWGFAFDDCTSLTTVSFNGTTPPTLGDYIFIRTPLLTTIIVPVGSEAAYKAALPDHAALIVYSDAIIVQTDGNGTATANKTSATAGEIITLTATPNSGYRFKEWQVVSGEVSVVNNQFTKPATAVIVKAIFELETAPPTTGTGTSTTSSSGGGSNKADVSPHVANTASTTPALSKTDATGLFTAALAAKPEGATAVVIKVRNAGNISKEALAEFATLAKKNGVALTVHFDTVIGGKVVSRISINPANATTNLDLTVKIVGGKITAPKLPFLYSLIIKLPAGFTMEKLVIMQDGKVLTNANPWLDKNGYLHFTTTGGVIELSQSK